MIWRRRMRSLSRMDRPGGRASQRRSTACPELQNAFLDLDDAVARGAIKIEPATITGTQKCIQLIQMILGDLRYGHFCSLRIKLPSVATI
jgi:hypothetical protein